jgi:hypothetical protein
MNLSVRRYLGRSRFVEELVENWQLEHERAMFAKDVEELVSECIELGELTKHAWKSALDQLFDEKVEYIDKAGKMLESSISKTLCVFDKISGLIKEAKRKGFEIEGSANFEETVRATVQVKAELARDWPWFDTAVAEEALADYRRGDYQTIEEIRRDTQTLGS